MNIDLLKDFRNAPKAFTTDAFIEETGSYYRPLQTLSYMVDLQISGENSTWMLHLTNVLLLGAISVLMLLFLKQFFIPSKLALASTLIYVVHPLFVSNVAWIPARGDLFLVFFSLLSFLFFIEYLNKKKFIYLILNWSSFTMALFSKETALFLPILFILYFLTFYKGQHNYKKDLYILSFYAISGILWLWVRSKAIGISSDQTQVAGFLNKSDGYGIIPLLQNVQTIPESLASFFFPIDRAPIPNFTLFRTFIGIVIIAFLSLLFIKNKERPSKEKLFCLSWFVLLLVPTMLLHTSIDYLPHRFFLPLIGILLFLLFILPAKWIKGESLKNSWLLIVVFLIFSSFTLVKSRYYKDPFTFYDSSIQWNPKSSLAYNNRGNLFNEQKSFNNAIADFSKAIELKPDFAEAFYNRGISLRGIGFYDQAISDFTKAIEIDPQYYDAYNNRGSIYIYLKQYDKAISDIKTAIKLQPDYDLAYYNYAYAYDDQGLYDKAVYYYSKVMELNPSYKQAYYNRGIIYVNQGLFDKANADFTKTIELNPEDAEAYFNRGNVYLLQGQKNKACQDFRKAEELGFSAAAESIAKSCN
jgi:tetratricopeptide (TPR) repeat protein